MFKFIKKLLLNKNPKKYDYILYRLISYKNKTLEFQYINSRNTFLLELEDVIFRQDILYCLNPLQSCFIGVEFAKYYTLNDKNVNRRNKNKQYSFLVHRYGKYKICYQDTRSKEICFIDKDNTEIFMDPVNIAMKNELIEEFDAAQSFYIGFQAGYVMKNNHIKKSIIVTAQKSNLRLVKS
jgi:hypothetical protein